MSEKGCIKCGSREAKTKEVAMTGTGLSKMFDIQHNLLSCTAPIAGIPNFTINGLRPVQTLLISFSVDEVRQ
jgi:hypothetical protein